MESKSQSTSDLIQLIKEEAIFPPGTALEGAEGIEVMAAFLTEHVHPDFVTVMVSQQGIPREFPGIDGFREGLSDWITPYERFRLVIDEVITQDDKVVFLVRQVATTKHGGVEIETASASNWSLLDGRIRQATFYIDPRTALEAAGIDPDSR